MAVVHTVKLDAPLGFAPRFTESESVVLLLHYRAGTAYGGKVAWPDYPKATGPRFIGDEFIPMVSASDMARPRVPGSFPRLHRNQVSALECILYS